MKESSRAVPGAVAEQSRSREFVLRQESGTQNYSPIVPANAGCSSRFLGKQTEQFVGAAHGESRSSYDGANRKAVRSMDLEMVR